MTYVIDPEGEYVIGPAGWVVTGQRLIEAISHHNLSDNALCAAVSHRPDTPGYLCSLRAHHKSSVHEADGKLRWWEYGYEWLDPEAKGRWLKRLAEIERVTDADEVSDNPL